MNAAGGGHAPRREVYVYWKLPRGQLDAASAGLATFQRALVLAHPGLQARLLLRADDTAAELATLMETYALPDHPGGVADSLLARLREQGDAATAPWRQGTRHLELFLDGAAG